MNIVLNMGGELIEMPCDVVAKWKVVEKTKIGTTYFMREQSGTYFSLSEHYYRIYQTSVREIKIDRILYPQVD